MRYSARIAKVGVQQGLNAPYERGRQMAAESKAKPQAK